MASIRCAPLQVRGAIVDIQAQGFASPATFAGHRADFRLLNLHCSQELARSAAATSRCHPGIASFRRRKHANLHQEDTWLVKTLAQKHSLESHADVRTILSYLKRGDWQALTASTYGSRRMVGLPALPPRGERPLQ